MEFEAIGTHWMIHIHERISDKKKSDIFSCVLDRIAIYDKQYSRFRGDSLVAKMSSCAGEYTLPDDAKPMFDLYEKMYHLTGGSVTPLIGNLLSDAGYDATYSLTPKMRHAPPAWEEAIEYNFPRLTIKQPVLIDIGAAGKGYLVDLVGELLEAQGVESFTINAGGDIVHKDANGNFMRVGLEHPDDATSVIGVATIGNESICGSAGNRRAWNGFHHIMDPHTLESPRHIAATWVIAKTGLLADALTTCLFFAEPEVLETQFIFTYLILYADFSTRASNGFNAELFL